MTADYIGQKPTFTALPNWLRGQATPMEGWVLWCLQSHFPNIHPSLNLLAKEACMSRRAVCTVLAGIERKGWLVREQSFSETGRQTATRYRLTIWDPHWAVEEGASGALVQEVHSRRGAGDAPSGVHDVHGGSAGGALKEDQSKKINSKKTLEPPLPPTARGELRPEAVAARPCRDRDGFPIPDPEPQPQAALEPPAEPPAAVQPQPQQPQAPRPLPEPAPDPEAIVPVKPKARKREAGFVPAHEDVPEALLPVARELLAFWPARKGAKTLGAWELLCSELQRIQDHPQGGTEIVRGQLQDGTTAGIDGKAWQSIRFSNWLSFGAKAGALASGARFQGKRTTMDRVMGAIALVEDRERKAAAAQQVEIGGLMLAEVA
jgi:hypothetical protein